MYIFTHIPKYLFLFSFLELMERLEKIIYNRTLLLDILNKLLTSILSGTIKILLKFDKILYLIQFSQKNKNNFIKIKKTDKRKINA